MKKTDKPSYKYLIKIKLQVKVIHMFLIIFIG